LFGLKRVEQKLMMFSLQGGMAW